ncbi:hypothetical protein ACH4U7_24985 [Streptomyces sp. NPDC020845]|uniref:hypothetical protein n=1 Tax=Streptomyces sp. NPDC020845 TaxID=3365096 RepID=UPI0037A3965D
MTVASNGYTVHVRDAETGSMRWSGKPWNPPFPMDDAEGNPDTGTPAEIPDLTVVSQDGREFIVAWGHGMKGKDDLHNGKEVVQLAIYPVQGSGRAVVPLREVSVPVDDGNGSLAVRDGGAGLLITWGEGITLHNYAASVDVATGKVTQHGDADELMAQCDEAACYGSEVEATSTHGPVVDMAAGGFGVPNRWFSLDVAPQGASTRRSLMGGWNGRVEAAVGGHLVARWAAESGEAIWAVHDAETGKVEATTTCSVGSLRPDEDQPGYPAVASRDGRYLAAGPLAFDLRQRSGLCLAGDGDRKEVLLASVRDDGTAYGVVSEGEEVTDDSTQTRVQVSLATGRPTTLGIDTEVPMVPLKESALFLTRDESDFVRISVLQNR